MPPKTTTWKLDEHTLGKHLVLRHYLNAWLPILGRTQQRILFIDGFAGPGEYDDGEPGSPIIALESFLGHMSAAQLREVRFLFIESKPDRAKHLEELLKARKLPENCHADVYNAQCAPALIELFDAIDKKGRHLVPTLLMLDPFGVAGVPMALIQRLLAYPRTEALISVMWEPIRRFHDRPEFADHLDELFGCPDWRATMTLEGDEARHETYALYESQLRKAGATYVLKFDLYRGNVLVYSLFFATKSDLGCLKMKEAMWRADPGGGFSFRGERGGQIALQMSSPDYECLRQDLLEELGDGDWKTIEEIEEFMRSDRTLFCTCKRDGLAELERRGLIQAEAPDGGTRRRCQFPAGTRIRRVSES